jgi:hypothetical protein
MNRHRFPPIAGHFCYRLALLRLNARLCLKLKAEAGRYGPRETGGILLGVAGAGRVRVPIA